MNDESRGSSSLRMGRISRALVVGQLAVSCGLLVAAGLMIRTVVNVARFDYGFDSTISSPRAWACSRRTTRHRRRSSSSTTG